MFPRAVDSKKVALGASIALMAASLVAGCSAVLGMPVPTLCPDGLCEDGPSKLFSDDAGTLPLSEAAPAEAQARADGDADPDPGDGGDEAIAPGSSRCGGGAQASIPACAKSVCCLTVPDGGAAYACAAESDCAREGYPIECGGPGDCASGSVCCHFQTQTVCDPEFLPDGAPGHCLDGMHGGDVVCDPHRPSTSCPSGSCSYPLDDAGAYYGCWRPPS
jgi:hypothetical protein